MDITDIRRARLKEWFADRSFPEKEKSYLSQLINGKASFGEKAARRLETDYGMGSKYLDQVFTPVVDAESPDHVVFEMLDVQAAAGNGNTIKEFPQVLQRVSVLESWAGQTLGGDLSRIKLITATGTSMQGTIENGDVLFIDVRVRHFDGDGIYAIVRSDQIQVKRLQRLHGNKLAIISDNREYVAETLSAQEADEIVICGRVLAAWNIKRLWS